MTGETDSTDVKDKLVRFHAATALAERCEYEKASRLFGELELESSNPGDVAALRLQRTICLTNLLKVEEAEHLFSEIDADCLSPEYGLSYKFEWGRIQHCKGHTEDALLTLTQALRQSEQMDLGDDMAFVRDGIRALRGCLLAEAGRPVAAIPVLKEVAQDNPHWSRARRSLGDCYFQLSEYGDAAGCYREVINAKKRVEELELNASIRNLGIAYYHLGKYRRAAKYLELIAGKYEGFPALKREIDDFLVKCASHR